MNTPLRLAAAIAIIAVVGYAGLSFFNPNGGIGSTPSPTPSPTASPTSSPGPTATPEPTPIDTSEWTTYTSGRYGFSIDHPAGWEVQAADHDWAFPADVDWLSTAQEAFVGTGDGVAPVDGLRVSTYSVPVAPGTTVESWYEANCAGYEDYCAAGDGAHAVTMDGYAGSLVEFTEEVQAFFVVDNRIYVVAAWRPEERDVLEAFISTMRLLPGGPAGESPSPS